MIMTQCFERLRNTKGTTVTTPRKTPVAKTADKAAPKTESKAVVSVSFDDDTLLNITTVEQALALAVAAYGAVDSVTDLELGNGFIVLQDKEKLVGRPTLILTGSEHFGDFGPFCSLICFTLDGTNARFIVNDGSTGVYTQYMKLVEKTGKEGGFTLPNGLRKSTYKCCPERKGGCGKPLPTEDKNGEITTCPSCDVEVGTTRSEGGTYYIDLTEVQS